MNKILCFLLPLVLFFVQHNIYSQDKDLTAKFEQYVRPYVESGNFSGRILVSQKGKILFNKAYGSANLEFNMPNDLNTVFHIGSLSKSFTAAAILLLEQRGLLTTEDLLSKYIPDYPLGNKITIHHLLSHTSGITDTNDLPEYVTASLQHQTPATLIDLYKNKPLEFLPGEGYQYSNSNYTLLAFIIEQLSKKSFGDFLKENIFIPLKMDHTVHHANMGMVISKLAEGYTTDGNYGLEKAPYLDWSSKTGSGSLVSSAEDLDKWNVALLGTSILSEKSKKKMFTEYGESGYGWYLMPQYDKNYIFMNGRAPGFCTHIGRYTEEGVCVIVLSNVQVYVPRQIAIDLAGILFNRPVETPALTRKVTDEELAQVIGRYKFGKDFYKSNFILEIKAEGGNLHTNYGEMIPNKPFQFFQRSYWLKSTFMKDAAGKVNGLMIGSYRGDKF